MVEGWWRGGRGVVEGWQRGIGVEGIEGGAGEEVHVGGGRFSRPPTRGHVWGGGGVELAVKASVRGMREGWGSGLVGWEELNS